MKTTIKVLVIIFAMFSAPSFLVAQPAPSPSVRVLSTKRYVFHFKVDKELIGGTIEVLDSCNLTIETEKIVQSKTIVDFFNIRAGEYTIKIKKDSKEYVFQYLNVE